MRHLAILSLFISGLVFSGGAKAQEMPPFAIPQIITADEIANLGVDFDDSFYAIGNPYLSDTMKLNYQISLLDKLVMRQSALDKIVEAYGGMGVSFPAPPPPRGICEQLPANGPCLAAYPELYSDLVAERKKYYQDMVVKAKEAEPDRKKGESDEEMAARKKREAEEKARLAEIEARKTRYKWAELTCLAGECKGVLVHSTDPTIRYTVHAGTRLPDGTVVESVRPGDVRVSMDGEMIKLRPAPGEEDSNANMQAINPLAEALSSSGVDTGNLPSGANGSTSEARAAAANIVANATGGSVDGNTPPPIASTPGPMPVEGQPAPPPSASPADGAPLGPSGLF